ncbi:MAG: spoIIIE [Verrucomicrobiales bacterium]|nr:spoIIIE [Verrucomicrobiales bacterium]
MSEFLYVLENPSMPDLVKIGRTERSVSIRVSELSSHTGVPTGFVVVKEYAVANSVEAERIIHERLSDYRLADNREFFRMEAEDATDIIDSILETVKPEPPRDFEREDELVAKATSIVARDGVVRPRMLEEMLGISYEEALSIIHALRGRGVIGAGNESKRIISSPPPVVEPSPRRFEVSATPLISSYRLPPMDFLRHGDITSRPTETKEELMANAQLLKQTLAQFDIDVSVGDIVKGPTFTRYELHAAPGIRLEEIAALSKNLAAALKAEQINILTPIPGKSAVGVDAPNAVRSKIIMRDLLESEEWQKSKARIPLVLGKDVYGNPMIADLTEMPHLMIAGNIGSGKSVCLNTIIISLLYRFSPDQLRFVMIDPNGIELQQYNSLPHLALPVVTDLYKGILTLDWVANEVKKRYQIFAKLGVRNIKSFNERSQSAPLTKSNSGQNQDGLAVDLEREIAVPRDEGIIIPDKLSYVLVLIENVEDLIQVAKIEVEQVLTYLIPNSRAAGIHFVLTTRQTGRNTISENIKADIPSRIAFRCGSRMESRSIIGEAGAEKLLGNGDMLFLPRGSEKLIRAQGVLITDQESQSCVAFIVQQGKPSWESEIRAESQSASDTSCGEDEGLIEQCIEVIRTEGKASVSLIQRRLRLGYTRTARILDELENRGIVGPSKGAESRDILIDLDAGDYTSPAGQLPSLEPRLVVVLCEHCGEKIEFDANELGDRQNVSVPCPHCGVETILSAPS